MNHEQPLVSIIIPTYNGAKRITKTLESLIYQDYDNIEIIVVDDVSTDNTVEICRELLTNSGRQFQIIKRTENGRQSASRNTGLKAANGKYVIFFDHDDLCEKNFVSSLCYEAEGENADVVFCGFKDYYELVDRFHYDVPLKLSKKYSRPEDYLKAWASRRLNISSVWNFMFSRNFLDKHNIHFIDNCYFGEDTEFTLKALAASSCTSLVNSYLYIHVHHKEQQTMKNCFTRHGQNVSRQVRLSRWRAGRYIIRHVNDSRVKTYAVSFHMAIAIMKEFTMLAENGDKENYERLLATTKHRKLHELMLSTYKILNYEPGLLFKSLMLIYTPKFYYWLRNKVR